MKQDHRETGMLVAGSGGPPCLAWKLVILSFSIISSGRVLWTLCRDLGMRISSCCGDGCNQPDDRSASAECGI
nr:plant UBX domain-containing protein 10 [Ipomoea trifida]